MRLAVIFCAGLGMGLAAVTSAGLSRAGIAEVPLTRGGAEGPATHRHTKTAAPEGTAAKGDPK